MDFIMGKVITVTSGKSGTGKTTVAAAISSSLAILGFKTLCLDFGKGAQNIENTLCMTDTVTAGNIDVLDGLGGVKRACRSHHEIPRLFVLTASAFFNPNKLGEPDIEPMFSEIHREFDFCIIDTSQLSGSGLSTVHAYADSMIIVTTGKHSSKSDVMKAVKIAHGAGISDVRLLVNHVLPKNSLQMLTAAGKIAGDAGARLIGQIPEDKVISQALHSKKPLMLYEENNMIGIFQNIARNVSGKSASVEEDPEPSESTLPEPALPEPALPEPALPEPALAEPALAEKPPPVSTPHPPARPLPRKTPPLVPGPPSLPNLSTKPIPLKLPKTLPPLPPLPPPPPSLQSQQDKHFRQIVDAGKNTTGHPVDPESLQTTKEPDYSDREHDIVDDTSKFLGLYGDPELWAKSTLIDADPDELVAVHVITPSLYVSAKTIRDRMWLHDLLDDCGIPYYVEVGSLSGSKALVEAQQIFVEKENAGKAMALIKMYNDTDSIIRETPDIEGSTILSDEGIPQKKCPSCDIYIDFDYTKCPHCKEQAD